MNLEKHLSKVIELKGEGKNGKTSRPEAKQTLKSFRRGKKFIDSDLTMQQSILGERGTTSTKSTGSKNETEGFHC